MDKEISSAALPWVIGGMAFGTSFLLSLVLIW